MKELQKHAPDFGASFHQTFPPTPAYIGRILSIADGTPRTAREISDMTGIPQGESSGKVVPHLKYAAYMGLIETDITKPSLTALGQIVLNEDRACGEELTQFLLHARLSSANGAPMWRCLVRELLHENRGAISKDYLASSMQRRFANAKYAPVLSTYNEFSEIEYLISEKASDDIRINFRKPQREFLYLYAYEMLREWDASYPEEREITADAAERFALPTCFAMRETDWFEMLLRMSERNILKLNRQLIPYTVVRLTDAQTLLPKLYTLLI